MKKLKKLLLVLMCMVVSISSWVLAFSDLINKYENEEFVINDSKKTNIFSSKQINNNILPKLYKIEKSRQNRFSKENKEVNNKIQKLNSLTRIEIKLI